MTTAPTAIQRNDDVTFSAPKHLTSPKDAMADDEYEETVTSISALASGDEDDIDSMEAKTFPMPVMFLSHGAGACFLLSAEEAPEMAGMDKASARPSTPSSSSSRFPHCPTRRQLPLTS